MENFQNLQVYQLSEKLANEIWLIVQKWDYFAKETVGKQIVKSTDSIGANIAEGNGRYNIQDNQRFVKIARGSLNETRHWLRLAYQRNLLSQEDVDKIKPIIDELSPKLNAQVLNVKKEVIKIAQNMVNSGRSIKIE
ncbi:four helix bundle protein [Umezakia ovalisporum]|uniref:four helix bundle protein n=1 Tax=Umezakia ovalisporum TaxID=75695 RepID=UPI0024755F95|nr:four helix bundle protein [Umezakia ovalisporum]MDH6084360.1 four helix bundle protein [Umezakia ovalisporum TAC611]